MNRFGRVTASLWIGVCGLVGLARAVPSPSAADTGAPGEAGWARFFEGDRERAREAFESASRATPDDPLVLSGLATLADEAGRFGEARELWVRILEHAKVFKKGQPAEAIAETAAAMIERLVSEAPGELQLARRLAAVDLAALAPEARSRLLAARAELARRHGDEAMAVHIDAQRGCPSQIAIAVRSCQ